MIEQAVKIYEDLLETVAAVVMNILIGNTLIGRGIETGSGTEVESVTDIGSWKETGTRTGIEVMIVAGRGTETGTRNGRETGSSGVIMTGDLGTWREKVEGNMRTDMMEGDIIKKPVQVGSVVGAGVGAEAEVGVFKLAMHVLIVIQVRREMETRRRHLHLGTLPSLRICMVM